MAKESSPFCRDWRVAMGWWKGWTSGENEDERARRKEEEAARLNEAEDRRKKVEGW
jgi:hypothetical protein